MPEAKKEEPKKKSKRGGARPGAGRKKKPNDAIGRNMSASDLKIRRDLNDLYKNGTALKAPDYLDDVAYNKWNEIMLSYSQLDINVLNILDITQLVLYCQSWSRYVQAYKVWDQDLRKSLAVSDKDTDRLVSRCLKQMKSEIANMTKLAPDLLLTPTGRAKYRVNQEEGKQKEANDGADSFDSFLAHLQMGGN